jgi:ubiquinone/menaquinone biosynthesis C-methylase UbiE
MGLKHSYSILAPFYDLAVAKATHPLRTNSIRQLNSLTAPGDSVLISGIGTGLDIPLLAPDRNYFGIDLTRAMLIKAKKHVRKTKVNLQVGDVMRLPYKNNSFDAVVMHLIVAVVGNPTLALQEAQRVLKENGHLIILDKFLKPGQLALVRRLINPIIRNLATQTSVTLEDHLHHCSKLKVVSDEPVLAGGWFRRVLLTKTG